MKCVVVIVLLLAACALSQDVAISCDTIGFGSKYPVIFMQEYDNAPNEVLIRNNTDETLIFDSISVVSVSDHRVDVTSVILELRPKTEIATVTKDKPLAIALYQCWDSEQAFRDENRFVALPFHLHALIHLSGKTVPIVVQGVWLGENGVSINDITVEADRNSAIVVKNSVLSLDGIAGLKTVSLYTVSGKLVKQWETTKASINLQKIATGAYIVKIKAGGIVITDKIVLEYN